MANESPSVGREFLYPHIKRTGPRGGKHYQYAHDTPAKLRKTHKRIYDVIMASPEATYKEISKAVGMSAYTVSNLVHNDAFRQYLETRSALIMDPAIRAAYRETCERILTQAAEIIARELAERPTFEKALAVADKVGKNRAAMERANVAMTQVNVNFPGVLEAARQRAQTVQANVPTIDVPTVSE